MASLARISAAAREDGEDRNPLSGIFKRGQPQVRPLEELVELIRPMVSTDLDVSLRKAQRKARQLATQFPNMSDDERAIITLYTIEMDPPEESLYYVLNEALRARDRAKVRPWRDVIFLLLTAMKKLPPVEDRVVHRAVKVHKRDLGKQAIEGEEFVWSGFSSTTSHVGSMHFFLGTTGDRTKWVLHLRPNFHTVKIQEFSLSPTENEILLPPNMEFHVRSELDCGGGLTEIQCDQLDETDPLMDFSIAAATSPAGYPASSAPAAPQPAQEAEAARRAAAQAAAKAEAKAEAEAEAAARREAEEDARAARQCHDGIFGAAQNGNLPAMRHFLRQNPAALHKPMRGYGRTPLHFAAANGRAAVVRLLLEHRASLEARDVLGGQTPLDLAIIFGHSEVAQILEAAARRR